MKKSEKEVLTKELVNEVLDLDYVIINELQLIGTNVYYTLILEDDILSDEMSINIHELAHLCKEWALDNGYVCHSVRNLVGYTVYFSGDCREPSGYYKEDTEPEAIFKACQWVLEQVNKR